jgi:hypothetical protein
MQLSNYFAPFTLTNIVQFILIFCVLDMIGFGFARLLHFPKQLRIVNWIFGLSFFVMIWFYLHMFVPFKNEYLWSTVGLLATFSMYPYIKRNGIQEIIGSIRVFPYFPFLLLPVIKPLFFLISAPPYIWDELAYHFYSPARILNEVTWPYIMHNGQVSYGMYDLFPRFLDTAYILLFSMTGTYATARLLHFLIFITCLWAVGTYVRKEVGSISAVLFSLGTLYLTPSLLRASTWGYVDAGTASVGLLSLIICVDWIRKPTKGRLLAIAALVGVGISSKYTVLPFLIVLSIVSSLLYIFTNKNKLYSYKQIIRLTLLSVCVMFFSGGYWYGKNITVTGNPIYPFLFPCKHGIQCGMGANYFSGWTIPLKLIFAPDILTILFNQQQFLLVVTLLILMSGIVLSIFKRSYISLLSICIGMTLIGEILVAKNISGFELRYFYHWSLLIPLVLVIPFGYISNLLSPFMRMKRTIFIVYTLVLLILIANPIWMTVQEYNSPDGVDGPIRNYAMYRMSLPAWLSFYFPALHSVIEWCGTPHDMVNIYVSDPGIIWTSREGLMRAYLTNCQMLGDSPQTGVDLKKQADTFRRKHKDSYVVSIAVCGDTNKEELVARDPWKVEHYVYNQEIICHAKKVADHLYRVQ